MFEFRGRNSAVECQLPKLNVEGSNPFARSMTETDARGHSVTTGVYLAQGALVVSPRAAPLRTYPAYLFVTFLLSDDRE